MKKTMYLVELAILTAQILLLSFTPLGYLRIGALSITFIPIPVILGAVVLGPKAGAILGTIFGLTSFAQCFMGDPFGAALLSISVPFTFLVCVPTRLFMGLFTGFIAKAFKEKTVLSYIVPSVAGPLLNTVLFTGTLLLLFWNAPVIAEARAASGATGIFAFFFAFIGINAIVELISCAIIATAASKAVHALNKRSAQ